MNEITLFLNNLDLNWNAVEIIAVLASIIYVILAAKQNIWCWLFAIISITLYIYICSTAKLFAETILQVFYLFMSAYGYYNWKKDKGQVKVSQWSVKKNLSFIFIGAVITFFMGFYLSTYTSAKMPIIDSFTTVFSIIATYMVAKKILENWLYWIIIDVVSIYIYINRDLHLTSLLFLLYTIIAIFGYFTWIMNIKKNA